ncbi:hypothetical protein [Microbacterium sp. AG1240]|uniref:hypothetical protein n=1 Tax=Microbacterium sp. AG1240 TaxID=2183992 RepID=UPI000EAC29FC|nr:hypothetical protein [Microbacterium sp. AG1240]
MADDADFSELMSLASSMDTAPRAAAPLIRKALTVTARSIKDEWRAGARRTGLAGYAASVDYDVKGGQGIRAEEIVAEIGPNLGKGQGSFGLVEDATGNVRSAPQHAGRNALRNNEADFFKGLEIAIGDATAEAVEK